MRPKTLNGFSRLMCPACPFNYSGPRPSLTRSPLQRFDELSGLFIAISRQYAQHEIHRAFAFGGRLAVLVPGSGICVAGR